MQSLRLFCDVASCRSFSQAAVRHGITQSAASQRIGQLEKRLGVTLFDRSVRPLTLTPAGDEFWRGCRELMARYDRLETRVARHQAPPAGEVIVDAIYSAGIDLLNQAAAAFQAAPGDGVLPPLPPGEGRGEGVFSSPTAPPEAPSPGGKIAATFSRPRIRERGQTPAPGISVTINYRRPEEVYESVLAQRCDLGILSYPQRWRDVGVIPLRNERMAVVCAPGHALAGKTTVNAGELAGLPMVTFESSLPVGRHIRRYLKDHGVTPLVTNVFDNIDTLKSAVAVTDQFSILPKRTVQREALAGVLKVVELEPELVRPMGIIYAKARRAHGRAFSPAAQAFVDFLLHQAGPQRNVGSGKADGGSIRPPLPSGEGRGEGVLSSEAPPHPLKPPSPVGENADILSRRERNRSPAAVLPPLPNPGAGESRGEGASSPPLPSGEGRGEGVLRVGTAEPPSPVGAPGCAADILSHPRIRDRNTGTAPSHKHRDIPNWLTTRARGLRREAPVPERILWGLLRGGRLFGLKFHRQHPLPPYVVDYYCAPFHAAVELDGESHARTGQRDAARDRFLQQQGVRVIRVTNDDLLADPIAVAEYIAEQISPGITKLKSPSPQPSPGGRGGKKTPSPQPSPEGRGGRTAPRFVGENL